MKWQNKHLTLLYLLRVERFEPNSCRADLRDGDPRVGARDLQVPDPGRGEGGQRPLRVPGLQSIREVLLPHPASDMG